MHLDFPGVEVIYRDAHKLLAVNPKNRPMAVALHLSLRLHTHRSSHLISVEETNSSCENFEGGVIFIHLTLTVDFNQANFVLQSGSSILSQRELQDQRSLRKVTRENVTE